MRAALVQLTSTDEPEVNTRLLAEAVAQGAAGGADIVLTPEVSNLVSLDREWQRTHARTEAEDPTLAAMRKVARDHGLWILLGSLALSADEPTEERLVNRSILLSPEGVVAARYDKIHMFDVEIDATETFRESRGFRPGRRAVVAETPLARVGMTICYDLRFPALYRALAEAGAQILTVPAAFSPVTGAAHWEVLLRARAIETGCFVLAPAQCGRHPTRGDRARTTHGHSLAVAPWGEILADGGTEPGITFVDLDLSEVDRARARVPALEHARPFEGP